MSYEVVSAAVCLINITYLFYHFVIHFLVIMHINKKGFLDLNINIKNRYR